VDDLRGNRSWDRGWLAEVGQKATGFIATAYEPWNRRTVIWHFYVSPEYRRRGLGRRLLDVALSDGVSRGAVSAWLETSNLNVPGIDAYRRFGFELCGVDVSLYEGTEAEGEVALFLRLRLSGIQSARTRMRDETFG